MPTREVEAPTGPRRTCVGCRQGDRPEVMLRVVAGPDGRVAVDPGKARGGRGAWVHPTRRCVTEMVKRHAAERSLKVEVQRDLDPVVVLGDLARGLRSKAASLVGVAWRTRSLAVGTEALMTALEHTLVPLIVVARDAGEHAHALAAETEAEGESRGPVLRKYGSKAELGQWLGRGEVALLGVQSAPLAMELVATLDRLAGLEER
ncbi:MAG: DUF448 domain-containing protein [Myxococcales bacterium]|nr:DUF448 domain-containing protein [Myxococcales bacterium]